MFFIFLPKSSSCLLRMFPTNLGMDMQRSSSFAAVCCDSKYFSLRVYKNVLILSCYEEGVPLGKPQCPIAQREHCQERFKSNTKTVHRLCISLQRNHGNPVRPAVTKYTSGVPCAAFYPFLISR